MKGPGLRLLVDVRRTWKCPRCGYEEHVGAQTTTVACPCCPGVAMKLSEHKRVYADELARLRSRPRAEAVANDDEVAHVNENEGDTSVIEELPGLETSHPANGDSQQIAKRRGARPHKQSRRGQHKQQQQSTTPQPPESLDPSGDSEE